MHTWLKITIKDIQYKIFLIVEIEGHSLIPVVPMLSAGTLELKSDGICLIPIELLK